jgi:hypothetical protein
MTLRVSKSRATNRLGHTTVSQSTVGPNTRKDHNPRIRPPINHQRLELQERSKTQAISSTADSPVNESSGNHEGFQVYCVQFSIWRL